MNCAAAPATPGAKPTGAYVVRPYSRDPFPYGLPISYTAGVAVVVLITTIALAHTTQRMTLFH